MAPLTRSSAAHAQPSPALGHSISSRSRLRPSASGLSSPPPGSGGWTLPPLNHFMTLPRTFLASHVFGSSLEGLASTPSRDTIARANRNRRTGSHALPSSSSTDLPVPDDNDDDEECETREHFVLPHMMQFRDGPDATGDRTRPLEEIDLTVSSSEDEGGEPNAGEADDVIEIHSPLSSMTMGASQPRRKRRRPGATTCQGAVSKARKRPCLTAMMRSAECTNIGMQNNEAVEKFKHLLKCAICLDVLEDITSTVCGHIFCAGCIRQAIRANGKCPLCQRRLHLKDTHPLFF